MGSRAANRKVTDERVERLLAALRGGCTRRAACGYAHLRPNTFYEMLAADDTLRYEVESAEAEAEATMTAAVVAAIPKSWQAAAWWLERRKYADYAQHQRVDMTIDLRREVERAAEEQGVDPAEVWAELREMGVPVPR